MDEQHWGDPQEFRPERFLDSSGNIISDSWFMPFGIGNYTIISSYHCYCDVLCAIVGFEFL